VKLPLLDAYEAQKPFREYEAWFLFKWSALSEVAGWTMLIYGILAEKFQWFGHGWAVNIGGSIHGILFIAYILIVITSYSSLGWSRRKTVVALAICNFPYGTLVFEQYAAYRRKRLQPVAVTL
jgi:integral membrane protein